MENTEALVTTEWLEQHLKAPDVRVVDASWYMPSTGRNAREEYEQEHIPGAVFFDIDEIADTSSPLPHMLPPAEKFSSRLRKLGLSNGNRVIIYDRASGSSAAARAWWMMRYFGHKDVAVLDGGLGKWLRESRPVEDLPRPTQPRHFMPRINTPLLRSLDQMKANIQNGRDQIVDARSAGRFQGKDPEPWPVSKTGHMPGALNVPWMSLVDEQQRTFRSRPELEQVFRKAGIDPSRPVVATCGSGVTACMIALGLYLVGHTDAAVYDGSWAEWGRLEDSVAVAD